jgi:catechol 2,3-dioxygenase-like lactoylglutathione lyase family enzyme
MTWRRSRRRRVDTDGSCIGLACMALQWYDERMLQGIDHINIVVSDIGRMVRFYTVVLGLRVSKHVHIGGEWIDDVVGLKGTRAEVVYLELEQGPRVELIRYDSPPAEVLASPGRPNLLGLRHVAFLVRGLDEVVERLRQGEVRFVGQVQQVPDEQVTYAGGVRKRLVYFHDPEGNLLELCEYAAGE